MRLPKHVNELSSIVDKYVWAVIDHRTYVDHCSPQDSIDSAHRRMADAKQELDYAVRDYVLAENLAIPHRSER